METIEHTSYRKIIAWAFTCIFIAWVTFFIWDNFLVSKKVNNLSTSQKREQGYTLAYRESLLENNPKPLQDYFLSDIKNGINDKYTKSDAYFILHRYFDNGGNIYEIIDYVNTHPELDFLKKEAVVIYPNVFKRIKNKELPVIDSNSSQYALLAAFEVLEKKGYANVAMIATAANMYVKLAYFSYLISSKHPTGIPLHLARDIGRDTNKAISFQKKSDDSIARILDDQLTVEDLEPRDILVGLNQYGSTLRYLQALGVTVSSKKSADEIFAYTSQYSKKVVPEYFLFTSFLDATTLDLDSNVDNSKKLTILLTPIFTFDTKKIKSYDRTVIGKILKAKEQKPDFFPGTNIEDEYYDTYSRRSIVSLAKKVPEFKKWLKDNGWKDPDFIFLN